MLRGRSELVPMDWVRELLTSWEAVDRIAAVCEGRPRGVPLKDALAHALPFLGGVLEDRLGGAAKEGKLEVKTAKSPDAGLADVRAVADELEAALSHFQELAGKKGRVNEPTCLLLARAIVRLRDAAA